LEKGESFVSFSKRKIFSLVLQNGIVVLFDEIYQRCSEIN